MKKRIVRTFCALMLGTLLLITVGTAMAAEPGYERLSYPTSEIPTIDGKWTTDDEWTDGEMTMIGEDIAFTSTWDEEEDVMTRWIVEFFSDTTDDPDDYWQFCIDPDQAGGANPQLGIHRMIQIIGHTDLVWYLGDGETWTETTGSTVLIDWADSLSASPTNSTPHWILEFQIAKNSGGYDIGNVWNFLLGASDASNPGFQSWPPTDPNVPDEWGVENYSLEPIPEALTFGVMALLSTVSMLVGYKYFAKRKETKIQ